MRLRWAVIGLAVFVLVLGLLGVLLGSWVKRRTTPPPPPIVVELPEVPADNGYDHFVSAAEMFVDTGVDLSTQPGVAVTADQRDALGQNEEALAELRRGLDKECVVPVEAPTPASWDRATALRQLGRLLLMQSRLASGDGRLAEAVPPLLDGLRFGAKLEVGANILYRLTAHAIQGTTLEELQRLAASQRLAEAELVAALRVLGQIEANAPPMDQTIEAECQGAEAGASGMGLPRAGPVSLSEEKVSAALREERDAAVRLSRKPYADVRAAIDSARPRPSLSPSKALAQTLSPTYRKCIEKDFLMRSRRRGTQVLLAVELYRLRHGNLPQSLSDLESLEIPGVALSLTDPLTEKPYVYRVQNGDYLLYSVGMDLKDDGGAKQSFSAAEPGDLLLHTPSE